MMILTTAPARRTDKEQGALCPAYQRSAGTYGLVMYTLVACHMPTCYVECAGRLFCNLKGLNAKQGDRLRIHVMSLGSQVRLIPLLPCTARPPKHALHSPIFLSVRGSPAVFSIRISFVVA